MATPHSRILIVDDEPEIVETLTFFLSNKGYEVSAALNGDDALRILQEQGADLILLDLIMPGLSGTQVTDIVKVKFPETKLMIITGYPSEGKLLSQRYPLDALFIKPVTLQELYTKIATILSTDNLGGFDLSTKQGIKTQVLIIRANLLFYLNSIDNYRVIEEQCKQRAYKGQHYAVHAAYNEGDLMHVLASTPIDIVVCDSTAYARMDRHTGMRIMSLCKEMTTWDLTTATFAFREMEKLMEHIRSVCIKQHLVTTVS